MKKILIGLVVLAFAVTTTAAQAPPTRLNVNEIVEIELLTSPELLQKIKSGKTSVLIAAGGTEIRGPHATTNVHTLLANRRAVGAAKILGNALVAPIIPIATGATGSRPANPTT